MTRVARTTAALTALRYRHDQQLPEAIALRADPTAEDYSTQVERILEEAANDAWRSIQEVFSGHNDIAALQQSWSVAHHHPVWVGLLFRAAQDSGIPALAGEAMRLRTLSADALRLKRLGVGGAPSALDGLGRWLLSDEPRPPMPVPDLGLNIRLKGSLRLRYHLACYRQMGQSLLALFKRAAIQPGPSAWSRRAEFARVLDATQREGGSIVRFRPSDIVRFSDRELRLFLDIQTLWPRLLGATLMRAPGPDANVLALIQERGRLQTLIDEISAAIVARNLPEVDTLVASAGHGPVVDAMGRLLRDRDLAEETDWSHPVLKSKRGLWRPMSRATLDRLERWRGRKLPVWWAMTSTEIHDALIDSSLQVVRFTSTAPAQDQFPICQSFSDAQALSLVRSGLGRVVRRDSPAWQALTLEDLPPLVVAEPMIYNAVLIDRLDRLPDARPWLRLAAAADAAALRRATVLALERPSSDPRAITTWEAFCATSVGTPEWQALGEVASAGTVPLRQAVNMYGASRVPVDAQSFRSVVARSLGPGKELPATPIALTQAWLGHDPDAVSELVNHANESLLLKLARHRSTPLPALEGLIRHAQGRLQRAAIRNRMRRAVSPEELVNITRHRAAGRAALGFRTGWTTPDGSLGILARLMIVRRSGDRLKQLASEIGEPAFNLAIDQAITHLSHTAPGDAVRLELVRALGIEAAPMLYRAVALIRGDAASGCRLDHAYRRFTLPKRNGGERTLHAPCLPLKISQRRILERLLQPVGAHPAALGFVPGRSIIDNAAPHQGRRIVVNVDVSNCFPSVRWPLVLAALRRHLADRLTPRAIGLLLDLCTAGGGLPIGAPSSPALLNWVLWRSDEILYAAASARGLCYTRYADDLSFSGGEGALQMIGFARRTLDRIGLTLDASKTNIFRRGRRQSVTGLVVNDQVGVPRTIRRKLRAAVHRASLGLETHWDGAFQPGEALLGRVAFVRMVHRDEGGRLLNRLGLPARGDR
jgi:hypothetical protein